MNVDTTKPDSLGRAFDPRKFRPQLDKLKRWVNLRLGRKPKTAGKTPFPPKENAPTTMTNTPATPTSATTADTTASGTGSITEAPTATPSAPSAPDFSDIDAASRAPDTPQPADGAPVDAAEDAADGASTANTIIGIIQTALVLIGEDEGVLSETEKTLLRNPLNRVLEKYDIGADVLPPEVDFAFALASIVIARLKKPKTATTFAKLRAWIAEKIWRRKGEKLAKEVKEATK